MKTLNINPFSSFDEHLLAEGRHYHSYEKLGAHLGEVDGITGVHFAVWAPNAERVSIIGDFNHWDDTQSPLYPHFGTGIWYGFVPRMTAGQNYKYYIQSRFVGYRAEKADPYAFFSEMRPKTASIVWDLSYQWKDQEWMAARRRHNNLEAPINIYEVHLGSWRRVPQENNRWLTYRELADQLPKYVKEMGFTHVEFLPVSEHPLDASWGYQTIGMFAVTSRFGTPQDFMFLVDELHRHGIGVILDWVPGHFPKDGHGLPFFDGTHLYEHADWRKGEHKEWGTLVFNYGRNEVSNYLISCALFWLDKYHIDGLRTDAVASMLYLDYSRKDGEWLPNEYGGREHIEAIHFIRRFNEEVYSRHPDVITVAEESTSWGMVSRPSYLGGLGFGLKWNMGWMHDMLKYMSKDPVYRCHHQNDLTFSMLYAFHENFILPFSHDEVVHGKGSMIGKMPGDDWRKFANLRLLYGYMYAHPGKKLLFMGGEFGVWEEWYFDKSLDWHLLEWLPHHGLQRWVRDLNLYLRSDPSLYQIDFDWRGFSWIDCHDHQASVLSMLRRGKDPNDMTVCVFNFTPVVRYNYIVGAPRGGRWVEVMNSDQSVYGGSDQRNLGEITAWDSPAQNQPCSLSLTLPPLGCVYLKPLG